MAIVYGDRATLGPGTLEARKALLDRVIWMWRRQGWRVELRSDTKATIAKGSEPGHLLQFLLVVLTFGTLGGVRRRSIEVDEFGTIMQRKL